MQNLQKFAKWSHCHIKAWGIYSPIGYPGRGSPAFSPFWNLRWSLRWPGTNPTNRHAFSNRHMIGWQLYPQQFAPYTVLRTSSIHRTVKAPWVNLATSLGFWLSVPNPLLPLDSYSPIDAENCDWLGLRLLLCLCTLTSCSTPDQRHHQPQSLTLTRVEPCNLIVAILTNILSFLYQALDASSPYDRDTQFKALHVTSCLNHHSILSLLNNRIRYSVDQDMMKRPSDANGGSLLHSPVRRQKPREIEVLVNPTRRK